MSPLAWIISQAEGLALATPWQRVQPALPGLIAARDHAAPQPRMGPVIAAQRRLLLLPSSNGTLRGPVGSTLPQSLGGAALRSRVDPDAALARTETPP